MSDVVLPGSKYNVTDLQASLGIHQVHKQEQLTARREEIAAFYDEPFSEFRSPRPEGVGDGLVKTVPRPPRTERRTGKDRQSRHVLHLYVNLLDTAMRADRNPVIRALLAENIGASRQFNPPHMHPYHRDEYGYKPEDFPVACRVGESEISLPLVPQMTQQDAEDVVEALRKVLREYRR